MCNEEIIVADSIAAGIYSQEQVEEFMAVRGEIPLHSYTGWVARGRKVRHGEKACLVTKLWRKRKLKDDTKEDDSEKKGSFYLTKTFLFREEQTELLESN